MGTVDKIYLFYDQLNFFTGDSLAIVYDREHETLDIKKEWFKKIFLFQKVYDNVLLCWITGDEAIFCEQLDETYIGDTLTNLFRKSLKNPSIPSPTKVVRYDSSLHFTFDFQSFLSEHNGFQIHVPKVHIRMCPSVHHLINIFSL